MFEYIDAAFAGPAALRFIVQPLLALILGLRDGRRDAKAGRPPYGEKLLRGAGHRAEILNEALRTILVPLCIGFVLDVVVRFSLGFGFRPLASALVGVTLVGLPYILSRGLAGRVFH